MAGGLAGGPGAAVRGVLGLADPDRLEAWVGADALCRRSEPDPAEATTCDRSFEQ